MPLLAVDNIGRVTDTPGSRPGFLGRHSVMWNGARVMYVVRLPKARNIILDREKEAADPKSG